MYTENPDYSITGYYNLFFEKDTTTGNWKVKNGFDADPTTNDFKNLYQSFLKVLNVRTDYPNTIYSAKLYKLQNRKKYLNKGDFQAGGFMIALFHSQDFFKTLEDIYVYLVKKNKDLTVAIEKCENPEFKNLNITLAKKQCPWKKVSDILVPPLPRFKEQGNWIHYSAGYGQFQEEWRVVVLDKFDPPLQPQPPTTQSGGFKRRLKRTKNRRRMKPNQTRQKETCKTKRSIRRRKCKIV